MEHQARFFLILKQFLPVHLNLAGELSSVLDISIDSAYRRLRTETALTLDETVKLCLHFGIPLEALNTDIPDVVTFQFNKLDQTSESFKAYLAQLSLQLSSIRKAQMGHIVYAAEDIPVFHHFYSKELSLFKAFYWRKSILNAPELETERFLDDEISAEDETLYQTLCNDYSKIPGTEIWTHETIESTLQQIRFYWDAGFFRKPEQALLLCDALDGLMQRVQRQTETGQKLDVYGASTGEPYIFYLCDLMIGNNAVFVKSDDTRITFLGYNSFNFIHTFNRYFNEQHEQWISNLIRKSILLSGVAEKIRNQFFKAQYRKIETLRQEIIRETN